MNIITHDDNPKIPKGKAILALCNAGWVGTNDGNPMGWGVPGCGSGMPALFPESQAYAIKACWDYVQIYHPDLDEMPHPEYIPEKARQWIRDTVNNLHD